MQVQDKSQVLGLRESSDRLDHWKSQMTNDGDDARLELRQKSPSALVCYIRAQQQLTASPAPVVLGSCQTAGPERLFFGQRIVLHSVYIYTANPQSQSACLGRSHFCASPIGHIQARKSDGF